MSPRPSCSGAMLTGTSRRISSPTAISLHPHMLERQPLPIDAARGVGGDRRMQAEALRRLLGQQGRARAGVEQRD